MKQYRHRPNVIEAQQWWPPGHARHDPAMLSDRKANRVSPPDYLQVGDIFRFSQPYGYGWHDVFFLRLATGDNVRLSPGDWIITGPNDKYPCKSGVFEANYDPVKDD